MAELLLWLKEYSPAVVVLLLLGAAVIYVLKLTVDRSIAAGFDTHVKELELNLQRRSAFKERILTERFTRIAELSARLEKVMTNLNRQRQNFPVPQGFKNGNEIVPLTEIYEDLTIHRLALTEGFFQLFREKANLALKAANAKNQDEWSVISSAWLSVDEKIRAAVEETFSLSEIRF